MKEVKLWPHLTIVAIICAVLGAGAVALWMKHEQRVAAESLPNAARIERVEGQVALNNSLSAPETEWVAASPNTPVSVGDRIYTRDNSRTSLAFTGRNVVFPLLLGAVFLGVGAAILRIERLRKLADV